MKLKKLCARNAWSWVIAAAAVVLAGNSVMVSGYAAGAEVISQHCGSDVFETFATSDQTIVDKQQPTMT